MAWIESHDTLLGHYKTKNAARRLGIKRVYLVGHLHALWWWALKYAPDGDLSGFPLQEIADAAEWEGDPAEFVEALLTCGREGGAGFLERDEEGRLVIHDWLEYVGKLLERRQANALRQKRYRERKRNAQVTRDTKGVTPDVTLRNGATNQPTIPTTHNHTNHNNQQCGSSVVVDQIAAFVANNIQGGTLPHVNQQVVDYCRKHGMEPDCVLRACEIAVEQGKPTFKYLQGILDRWREAGIRTREQAEYAEEQYRRHKRPGKDPPQIEYRRLTPEEKARSEELTRELQALADKMAVKDE